MLLTLPFAPVERPRRPQTAAAGYGPHVLNMLVDMHNEETAHRERAGTPKLTAPPGLLWRGLVLPYMVPAVIRHDDGSVARYRVRPGAFDRLLHARPVTLLVDHDHRARLFTTATGELVLWSTPHGLYAGTHDRGTALVLNGCTARKELSAGFNPLLTLDGRDVGGPLTDVFAAELVEVSLVEQGAFHHPA